MSDKRSTSETEGGGSASQTSEELPDTEPLPVQDESFKSGKGTTRSTTSLSNIDLDVSSPLESPIVLSKEIKASTPQTPKRLLKTADSEVISIDNSIIEVSSDSMKSLTDDSPVINGTALTSEANEKPTLVHDKQVKLSSGNPVEGQPRIEGMRKRESQRPDKSGKEIIGPVREFIDSATVVYSYKMVGKEIISVKILEFKNVSSEGYEGDNSSNSGNVHSPGEVAPTLVHLPRLSVQSSISSSSSSSVPSSAAALQRNLEKKALELFRVPGRPPLKKNQRAVLPQHCLCSCFCDAFSSHVPLHFSSAPEVVINSAESSSSKASHKITTSAQKENGVPEVIIEENLSVTEKSTLQKEEDQRKLIGSRTVDSLVFGKWDGGNLLLPGFIEQLISTESQSHFEVSFLNGDKRKVPKDDVLPARLIGANVEAMVLDNDNNYVPARIMSTERPCSWESDNMNLFYSVMKDSEIQRVPFDKLAFTDACLKEVEPASIGDGKRFVQTRFRSASQASLESHSENRKRQKTSRKCYKKVRRPPNRKGESDYCSTTGVTVPMSQTTTESSGIGRRNSPVTRSARKRNLEAEGQSETEVKKQALDLSSECCEAGPSNIDTQHISSRIPSSDYDTESSVNLNSVTFGEPLDPEYIPPSGTNKRGLGNRRVKSSSRGKLKEEESLSRKYGPIPVDPIFSEFCFVLTHAKTSDVPERPANEGQSSSGDEHFSSQVPFDYFRLKAQITAGKGELYTYITEIPQEKVAESTIVICDAPCKTFNYLFSVLKGIRIYFHDLIVDCCLSNKHVSELLRVTQFLPRGFSIEKRDFVLESRSQHSHNVFKDLLVLIALSENESGQKIWKKLIETAGGTAILLKRKSGYGSFEAGLSFILGDNRIPNELKVASKKHGIPILTTTWIIQSIIHGEPRRYTSHPQYALK